MPALRNLVVFATLLISFLHAQQNGAPDYGSLKALAAAELKEIRAPGAAIAIVSGDRVVFAEAFGVANIETGSPVGPEMLFRIGSVTKMLTASAIVGLAEEHKVDLQLPIGRYVPGLSTKLASVTLH